MIVCAGGGPFKSAEIDRFKILGLDGRIEQHSIDDYTLAALYKNAIAFVFPFAFTKDLEYPSSSLSRPDALS